MISDGQVKELRRGVFAREVARRLSKDRHDE